MAHFLLRREIEASLDQKLKRSWKIENKASHAGMENFSLLAGDSSTEPEIPLSHCCSLRQTQDVRILAARPNGRCRGRVDR
jgi:hypothetical protein